MRSIDIDKEPGAPCGVDLADTCTGECVVQKVNVDSVIAGTLSSGDTVLLLDGEVLASAEETASKLIASGPTVRLTIRPALSQRMASLGGAEFASFHSLRTVRVATVVMCLCLVCLVLPLSWGLYSCSEELNAAKNRAWKADLTKDEFHRHYDSIKGMHSKLSQQPHQ